MTTEKVARAEQIAAALTSDASARGALMAYAIDRVGFESDPGYDGYPGSYYDWHSANDLTFALSDVRADRDGTVPAATIRARVRLERAKLAGRFIAECNAEGVFARVDY